MAGSPAPALPTGEGLRSASVEELFIASGALLEGHFLLKSGRHSARYLEKFGVLQHPPLAVEICRRMADELESYQPDVVVGPTTGGVLLAFEVARQLGERTGRPIRGIFAEPAAAAAGEPARRELRRGFAIRSDERAVLVDDILTTGASLHETIAAVRAAGGEPLAAVVIADRASRAVELGFPLTALGRIEIDSWPPHACPLCRDGVAATIPGSSSARGT